MTDAARIARDAHESQADCVLDELQRAPIRRLEWERRNQGARIAPAIDVLRNTWGYEITGTGRFDDPYVLVDPNSKLLKFTDEMYLFYLTTDHWRDIRRRRLMFDGNRCVACHSTNELQVHHWNYELFNESLTDLMTLCKDCHKRFHSVIAMGKPKGISIELAHRLNVSSMK